MGWGEVPDPKKCKHECEMKKLAEKVDVYQIRAEQVDCEQGRGLFLGQGKKKKFPEF